MKIYELIFENSTDQKPRRHGQKIAERIEKTTEEYQDKSTTIDGRTIIINTMILSQLIYLITIFEPEKRCIKNINEIIRKYF